MDHSTVTGQSVVRFGLFEFNPETGELRRDGLRVKMPHQPATILAELLQQPGRLVGREELERLLWPEAAPAHSAPALNIAVKKLRGTLGDSATQPRYIETIPKRGYRFIAPVGFAAAERPVVANFDHSPPDTNGQASNGSAPVSRMARVASSGARDRFASRFGGWRWLVIGAAFSLLTGSLAVTLLTGTAFHPEPARAARPVVRFSLLLESLGSADRGVAISPNGRHIAYIGGPPDFSMWVRDLDSEQPRMLEGSAGARRVVWSPDSQQIAFATANHLKRISVLGGPAITICRLPANRYTGGDWSPDGKTILFSAGEPLAAYLVPADGGEPALAFEPADDKERAGVIEPVFLPGANHGQVVAYAARGPLGWRLVLRNLATGETRSVADGSSPFYSPDGRLLYRYGNGIWAVPISVAGMRELGSPSLIAELADAPTVSRDGTLVYADPGRPENARRLAWWDRAGNRIAWVGEKQQFVSHPELSPDGRHVAYRGLNETNADIWLQDLAGPRMRATVAPASEAYPVWHPSGRRLFYQSNHLVGGDIFSLAVPIAGGSKRLLASPRDERPQDVSPDGRWLLYSVVSEKSRSDIWVLGERGGEAFSKRPLVATEFDEVAAKFSPDGRFAVYCSDRSGQYEIYVTVFPAGGVAHRVSTDGGFAPRWSDDGREIFFIDDGSLLSARVRLDPEFRVESVTPLFQTSTLPYALVDMTPYDVSSDGERFLVVEELPGPEPAAKRAIHVVQNWAAQGGAN